MGSVVLSVKCAGLISHGRAKRRLSILGASSSVLPRCRSDPHMRRIDDRALFTTEQKGQSPRYRYRASAI